MRKYLFVMAQEGYPWGGSEPLWSSAAKHLASVGNEVRISAKRWDEPVPQIEQLRSVGCRIFYRKNSLPLWYRCARKILPFTDYKQKELRLAIEGVDLVIISQGANFDGLPLIESVRALGYKYAVIAQGAAEQWWPDDDTADRLAKSYDNATRAYFVSQANVELSRRQFGSALCNAKVVRNPFNVRYDVRLPWPKESTEELVLACVARLDVSHKGQDLLLRVLDLPRWRARKVRLSLIGKGMNERWLRRAVNQLNLANVHFTGHVEDIEGVWAQHHALVLASRYEGLPLALVEAMLCGRPGIVTDVGGNRELILDGINGFIARAPMVEFLDETLNRVWENRQLLKEIGDVAASDVRDFVSADPGAEFARELALLACDS